MLNQPSDIPDMSLHHYLSVFQTAKANSPPIQLS
jgi:hypothetical protein